MFDSDLFSFIDLHVKKPQQKQPHLINASKFSKKARVDFGKH